jgi:hypothetical protein
MAGEIDRLVGSQEFGKAVDRLYKERRRRDEYEWMQKVDAKSDEVVGKVEDLFSEVKSKALAARARGDAQAVEEATAQVVRWGIERFVFDLKKALESASAPPAQGPAEQIFDAPRMAGGGGKFAIVDAAAVGKAWTTTDSLESGRHISESYVEVEFQAQAGVAYKCHVYLGSCCSETLILNFQCSEMHAVSRDRVRRSIDPGNRYYLGRPVESPDPSLPREHAGHAPAPPTWMWRTLQLPVFQTSGPKKLRILSRIKGASVAFVVVSSSAYLDGPPKDLESLRK